MMVLFFHAARLALIVFDPFFHPGRWRMCPQRSPDGVLITEDHYYPFSSVFFYANRAGLLLNGRSVNLEYGSYAPGAANVFIDDSQFANLWMTPARYYLLIPDSICRAWKNLWGFQS